MPHALVAGAAAVDATPPKSQFLFGYPHVPRHSTGVHDPLYCSALFLSDGCASLLWIACDVIFVERALVERARKRIEQATGVSAGHIMVTATHTHSGPVIVDMLSNAADAVVPHADADYLALLEERIVEAAVVARRRAIPAEIGLAIADGSCVGTNRHDPAGPRDPQVPVLAVRAKDSPQPLLGMMLVCSMHPTVLHEDSTLVSGDFPGMARRYLQQTTLGAECPVIYHTGPCGNLSPRYVTRSNTFAEAERLGTLLGQSVEKSLAAVNYVSEAALRCERRFVDLPLRMFPPVSEAEEIVSQAAAQLAALRGTTSDPRVVRTAECRLFGAEETLSLSRAAAEGRLAAAAASAMPAEVMAMQIGPWTFVSWPGEAFVEFALKIKERYPNCFVISLANGELQGYVVTEQAVRDGSYEALNAAFASPASGKLLVDATMQLLNELTCIGNAKSVRR